MRFAIARQMTEQPFQSNDDNTFCRCVGVLRWMVALDLHEASSKNMVRWIKESLKMQQSLRSGNQGQHKVYYPTGFQH